MFQLDTTRDAQSQFSEMALKLINQTLLKTPSQTYRLAEIEFYVFAKGHEQLEDIETHQHKRQLMNGHWYIHRKSPERTGIEIAFGNKEKEIYAGILIRAIQNIANESDYVYGTAAVVKALLEASGSNKDQVEGPPINQNTFVTLIDNPEPFTEEIFACPRHLEGNEKKKFTDAPYRFFCLPQKKHVLKEKVIIPYLIKTLGREKVAEVFKGSALPQ